MIFLLFNQFFSSHLVSIPAGTSLSDALRKSPIIDGGDGGAASAGGFDMDADAAADPELAMALRISLEEQRARQQQSGADNNETKEDNNQAQPMDQDQQMLQGLCFTLLGGLRHDYVIVDEYVIMTLSF